MKEIREKSDSKYDTDRTWYVQNRIPGGGDVSDLAAEGERHLVGQRRGSGSERI